MNGQIDKRTNIRMGKQTNRKMDKRTNRQQAEKSADETEGQTHIDKEIYSTTTTII